MKEKNIVPYSALPRNLSGTVTRIYIWYICCSKFRWDLTVTLNGTRLHRLTLGVYWYDEKGLWHTFHSSFISSCWESSLLVNI